MSALRQMSLLLSAASLPQAANNWRGLCPYWQNHADNSLLSMPDGCR